MTIDRIYIAGCRLDLRWTQCCVASIRRWYPRIPISLLKDLHRGAYDTSELEAAWDVTIAPSDHAEFGWGMSKLEPLLEPTGERVLVIDSDVLFLGPVLDDWERFDEDVVVDNHAQPDENVDLFYFDRTRLRELDPLFDRHGSVFNCGVVLATTGVLRRADFEPFIDFTHPRTVRDPLLFRCGDQGVVNYVILRSAQQGRLSLRGAPMQEWAGYVKPSTFRTSRLTGRSPYRTVLHYAGPKKTLFSANRNSHVLRHFEAAYYARLPGGPSRRRRDRVERLLDVLATRLPWTQYL
ncbi:MAG: hypothetical protein AB7Q29_09425 [Vicinamibacterales bacterium]